MTLVDDGLPEPLLNFDVFWDGVWIARVDLAYPELKIAIEYEGAHHQTDPNVFADDIARRELMEAAGWLVIRVIADHLRQPDRLANRVRRALIERTSTSIR